MGVSHEDEERPDKGSVMLALRYYRRELTRLWRLALPAMLGPALGNIGIGYLAPLIVAQLVTRIAGECAPLSRLSVSLCARFHRHSAALGGALAHRRALPEPS